MHEHLLPRIAVYFAKESDYGERIGDAITRWLHLEHTSAPGLGLPVEINRLDPTHRYAPASGPAVTVVVLDAQMLKKHADWLSALSRQAAASATRRVLPVMLHPAASRLELLGTNQALAVVGLSDEEMMLRIVRSVAVEAIHLLDAVTVLECEPTPESPSPLDPQRPVEIFVSYRHKDGAKRAASFRECADRDFHGLRCWVAHLDARGGLGARKEISDRIKSARAAIAVSTEGFAQSDWCRSEIMDLRQPKPFDADGQAWAVVPTVVAQTPGEQTTDPPGWSTVMPELAGLPQTADSDEATVIDRALWEGLRTAYNKVEALRHLRSSTQSKSAIAVTWAPEPTSLLKAIVLAQGDDFGLTVDEILYPADGMTLADRQVLDHVTPAGVQLRPFESLAGTTEQPVESLTKNKSSLRIALSLSSPGTIAATPFSHSHLAELELRLAAALASLPARIAYGGVVGHNGGHAEALHAFATRQTLRYPPEPPTSELLGEPLYINFAAWPYHLSTKEDDENKNLGTYKLVRVNVSLSPGTAEESGSLVHGRKSHALSRMRKMMASWTQARIAIGGKEENFVGIMPGVAEECRFHLCYPSDTDGDTDSDTAPSESDEPAPKPVYFVGAFGGAAKSLGEFVVNAKELHEFGKLESKWRAEGRNELDDLAQSYPTEPGAPYDVTRKHAEASYSDLQSGLKKAAAMLAKSEVSDQRKFNGLSARENKDLFESEDLEEIVGLVMKGLASINPAESEHKPVPPDIGDYSN